MLFSAAAVVLALVSASCFALVLVHAFRRSVGTGVMVLCIPAYNLVYGYRQFEHRWKGAVLAGWVGGLVLAAVAQAVGAAAG